MNIAIICNPVYTYDREGWSPTDVRLSGTEESIVEWAERLVRLGHSVDVYKNGEEVRHNGVRYLDRNKYDGGYDTTLNVNSDDIAPIGKTYYFTNQTNAPQLDLSAYDGVIWPSKWAKANYPVNNRNVLVVPHGHDAKPGKKIPRTVLYASSPDRGLDTLLAVWPEVVRQVPDAQLFVTYGGQARDVPNTTFLGNVTKDEMNQLFAETDIWAYPCDGVEMFCMVAVKAQASGCVPVYYPHMALEETVQAGVVAEKGCFTEALLYALDPDNHAMRQTMRQTLANLSFPNWDESTAMLLSAII